MVLGFSGFDPSGVVVSRITFLARDPAIRPDPRRHGQGQWLKGTASGETQAVLLKMEMKCNSHDLFLISLYYLQNFTFGILTNHILSIIF